MGAHASCAEAFPPEYLRSLRRQIRASPYFTTHTLNRDFVGTRGFSVVFRNEARMEVELRFPFFAPYLARVLRADCNAFYLNPLLLVQGSRVDPHVDRSLRSYCKDVLPPVEVSVLYVEVPPDMRGGALVLARGKRHLARVQPARNVLVTFDGDLTHSIERMESAGERLSLVCEQYQLTPEELEQVPRFQIETRARGYD
jgi:hypothetical protein